MSVSQILTTYDGQEPTLCIAGGGGGSGVNSVSAGPGLTITGGLNTPQVNLAFTGPNQLVYGTGNNAGAILGPGGNNDFLRINNSGNLEWHPISAGGVVSVSANPGGACFVNNANASTPAVAIAFPAGAKGAIPASLGTGANLGSFLPGPAADGSQQNYVLSADNMSAVGFSWKAAAGTAITGEAPLVEFVDGTLTKVGINFAAGANGIGQIPVGISDPAGKVGTLTPTLTVADDGKVLTASSADAAVGGVAWKTLTGPGGAIGTNAPLFDDYVAPNNTIGIDFAAGAGGIGQIPVGISSIGGKIGTLTPALTAADDGKVLTASSAAAAAGGVVWSPIPTVAGTVVNRASAHLGPTTILPPTSVNAEMVLVAEEPVFEFWAASGTAAAAGILPPFIPAAFIGKTITIRAENIQVAGVSTPAIVMLDNGTPIYSFWGGSIPASPAVNGFFNSNVPPNMVAYGDFDNIGVYVAANVGNTVPDAWRPYNVACFQPDGLGAVEYDNQFRFSTGGSKGIIGGPVYTAAVGSIAFGNPCWVFGGSFNALEGLALTPHNIVYISFFPVSPYLAQWQVPAGFGTDGPVYSLVYDNPNLFIGGDFQNYGAPPATAGSPFLYLYNLDTSVPSPLPTALTGFVLNMEISAVQATRLIVYGNPQNAGPTGSRAVYIDTGTLAITPSGLPGVMGVAGFPLNKASRAITSAVLIINPPAATTDTYDVIAIAGLIGEPVSVYIFSAAIGSWEYTGDAVDLTTANNPICMYYNPSAAPSPVLFCQADAVQYEYNQLTATPTASFTLANGFLFNSNTATSTATMNANTSQYFIAGVNGTKWICSGATAPGLVFS